MCSPCAFCSTCTSATGAIRYPATRRASPTSTSQRSGVAIAWCSHSLVPSMRDGHSACNRRGRCSEAHPGRGMPQSQLLVSFLSRQHLRFLFVVQIATEDDTLWQPGSETRGRETPQEIAARTSEFIQWYERPWLIAALVPTQSHVSEVPELRTLRGQCLDTILPYKCPRYILSVLATSASSLPFACIVCSAFSRLLQRPESSIAVVSHSGFLRHLLLTSSATFSANKEDI